MPAVWDVAAESAGECWMGSTGAVLGAILIIDHGRRVFAEAALAFAQRFA